MRIAISTILVAVVLLTINVHAAENDFGSAMIVGVGGAIAMTPDEPGVVWMNPALAMFANSRGGASLSYRKHFELDDLREMDASVRHRLFDDYTVSAAFARYGEQDLYLESRLTGAVARQFSDRYAAGIGIEYDRTEFGAGNAVYSGVSLTLSAAAEPLDHVIAAASLRRIAIDDFYDGVADNPGLLGELSVAWSAPPDITVGAVWSRAEDDDDRFGIGQRLRFVEGLEFISGLRFDPVRYTLGGRFTHRMGSIDYVYLSHNDLGGTHTIGVAWAW
ncbi:MAG: hypothetical protein GF341_05595 [candidate division Zixibacteria bacterium]|nr:hypothetical protein [candidate division Zixibacteria bacterium]